MCPSLVDLLEPARSNRYVIPSTYLVIKMSAIRFVSRIACCREDVPIYPIQYNILCARLPRQTIVSKWDTLNTRLPD